MQIKNLKSPKKHIIVQLTIPQHIGLNKFINKPNFIQDNIFARPFIIY
jgi:hypothetical protein